MADLGKSRCGDFRDKRPLNAIHVPGNLKPETALWLGKWRMGLFPFILYCRLGVQLRDCRTLCVSGALKDSLAGFYVLQIFVRGRRRTPSGALLSARDRRHSQWLGKTWARPWSYQIVLTRLTLPRHKLSAPWLALVLVRQF